TSEKNRNRAAFGKASKATVAAVTGGYRWVAYITLADTGAVSADTPMAARTCMRDAAAHGYSGQSQFHRLSTVIFHQHAAAMDAFTVGAVAAVATSILAAIRTRRAGDQPIGQRDTGNEYRNSSRTNGTTW